MQAAKLVNFHFHDLRHTFASWAIQRGATLPELKDLLGHSSLAMVMRYAHLSPEHLRSAVGRLSGMLTMPSSADEPDVDREGALETGRLQPTISPERQNLEAQPSGVRRKAAKTGVYS